MLTPESASESWDPADRLQIRHSIPVRRCETLMKSPLCCAVLGGLLFLWLGPFRADAQTSAVGYEPVSEHFGVYHDGVNVGVIRANNKTLLMGSGDGRILDAAQDLHLPAIEWVLYTDH